MSFTDSYAQSDSPIETRGLLTALKSEILSTADIVGLVQKRGVSFQITPAIEKQIRIRGKYLGKNGLDDLVGAVRNNFRPKKPKPTAASVITQTMTNSPGAIQAGRDVVIQADRRVIQSIVLRVSLEVRTSETPITEEEWDLGLGSMVALFTDNKTRIRFVTDSRVWYQQVTPRLRRMRFVYTPETPEDIHGRDIAFLESISTLVVNYKDIFTTKQFAINGERVTISLSVELNGLKVGEVRADSLPGVFAAGQSSADLSELFRHIPSEYSRLVSH